MCGKSVHPIFDHKNLVVLGLYKVILGKYINTCTNISNSCGYILMLLN